MYIVQFAITFYKYVEIHLRQNWVRDTPQTWFLLQHTEKYGLCQNTLKLRGHLLQHTTVNPQSASLTCHPLPVIFFLPNLIFFPRDGAAAAGA